MSALREFDYESALTFQIAVLSNLVSRPFYAQVGRETGMTLNEWRILLVLANRPGASQADIVQATGLHKMTVSRSLRAMTRLIRQEKDPADSRKRLAYLTEEGVARYRAALPLLLWRQNQLEAILPAEELTAFRAMLARLIETARKWPDTPDDGGAADRSGAGG